MDGMVASNPNSGGGGGLDDKRSTNMTPIAGSLEQQLKHVIPGFLILIDLCLIGVPLYLCHVIYVILVYYGYLAVVTLCLFLSYILGIGDRNSPEAGNPTVWIAGYPFLPNGYSDFTNVHRILGTVFGSAALAIVVHCLLLSVVILRDFFASLFHRSTELWIDDTGPAVTGDPHLTDQLFTPATPSTSTTEATLYPPVSSLTLVEEKPPLYDGTNTAFNHSHEVPQ
ncbi:unnamed protein product [Echinostoma caproni]|uniref:Transmembrane protein n=1 Tax=Echinostoma caproni TaxID=27848 RepID=A0A183ASH4_9TREM|nr:unnamed protein product [Echinostoma caproni]